MSLTEAGATLDLTGDQRISNLTGVAGTSVTIGGTLTVGDAASTTYAGRLTGGLTKIGSGILTLAGDCGSPEAARSVRAGALKLATSLQAAVTVDSQGTVTGAGTVDGDVTNSGTVTDARLSISGAYTQKPQATLRGATLTVHGSVTLAGKLDPGTVPATPETLIDNTGTEPARGTFDGLAEGATIGGRTITYHGGDGNDVVLSGLSPGGDTAPVADGQHLTGADVVSAMRAGTSDHPTLWILIIGSALAVAASAILVARRRKSEDESRRTAAPMGRHR